MGQGHISWIYSSCCNFVWSDVERGRSNSSQSLASQPPRCSEVCWKKIKHILATSRSAWQAEWYYKTILFNLSHTVSMFISHPGTKHRLCVSSSPPCFPFAQNENNILPKYGQGTSCCWHERRSTAWVQGYYFTSPPGSEPKSTHCVTLQKCGQGAARLNHANLLVANGSTHRQQTGQIQWQCGMWHWIWWISHLFTRPLGPSAPEQSGDLALPPATGPLFRSFPITRVALAWTHGGVGQLTLAANCLT